jgi:hypothetical protein
VLGESLLSVTDVFLEGTVLAVVDGVPKPLCRSRLFQPSVDDSPANQSPD